MELDQEGRHAGADSGEETQMKDADEAASLSMKQASLGRFWIPEEVCLSSRLALGLAAITALFDYLFYLGTGGMSYAIAAIVLPAALLVSARPARVTAPIAVFVILFVLFAARCAWQVHFVTCALVVCSTIGFSIVLKGGAGVCAILASFFPTAVMGYRSWRGLFLEISWESKSISMAPETRRKITHGILLPLAVMFAFGLVFLFANPVLQRWYNVFAEWGRGTLSRLWETFRPDGFRIIFWLICLWFLAGLFRPWVMRSFAESCERGLDRFQTPALTERVLYAAAVNTLLGVNLVFLVYNVVDMYYLAIRRELPTGINHSQYAHQGALWLTVALAMTTVVLGIVFSGTFNSHPRKVLLKRLAGVWLFQNFLLAWWVLMRVGMYIDYNGLTRMRLVALFGVAAVIAGLCLVTVHIRRDKPLSWLIGRQIVVLFGLLCLLSITPLDAVAWKTNVRLLLTGKAPMAAVQLAVQPVSPEGLMQLTQLLEHPDPVIASGAAAMLGQWYFEQPALKAGRWTTYQLSDSYCRRVIAPFKKSILRLIPDKQWAPHRERLRSHTARWI